MATTWIRVVSNGNSQYCVERLDGEGNFFRVSDWLSTSGHAQDIMCGMTYLRAAKDESVTANATQDSDGTRNTEIEVQEETP